MFRERSNIRIVRLLMAVLIPVLGIMAQQHHGHMEEPQSEQISHSHEHGHAHPDEPVPHDHQPVDGFLSLAATTQARVQTEKSPDLLPTELGTLAIRPATDFGPEPARDPSLYRVFQPSEHTRPALLRFAANLPPPILI